MPQQRGFPSGPVANTPLSNTGATGSIPGQGAEVPYAAGYGQKLKKKILFIIQNGINAAHLLGLLEGLRKCT